MEKKQEHSCTELRGAHLRDNSSSRAQRAKKKKQQLERVEECHRQQPHQLGCFTHQIIHVLAPSSHSSTNCVLALIPCKMFLAWASPKWNVFDVHVASYCPPFECHGGIKKRSPNLFGGFSKNAALSLAVSTSEPPAATSSVCLRDDARPAP